MAKKKETNPELDKAFNACVSFLKLCGKLFNPYTTALYNINELKESDEYYKPARDLCEELEIDWDDMTHEESNRIMLALLEDYYNAMQVDKEKNYVLKIKVEEK